MQTTKATESTLLFNEMVQDQWDNPIKGNVVSGIQIEYFRNYGYKSDSAVTNIVRRRRLVRNRLVVAETGYSRDGKIAWYQSFKNGLRHGEAKGFHEDGTLANITSYEEGEFHGLDIHIGSDGMLNSFHIYNKGKEQVGAYMHEVNFPYNPDGILFTKKEWKALGKKV